MATTLCCCCIHLDQSAVQPPCTHHLSPRTAAGTLARCATAFNVKQVWLPCAADCCCGLLQLPVAGSCQLNSLSRICTCCSSAAVNAIAPQVCLVGSPPYGGSVSRVLPRLHSYVQLLHLLSLQILRRSAWWAHHDGGSVGHSLRFHISSYCTSRSKLPRRSAWWARASSTHLGRTAPASLSTFATTLRWRSA